MSKKAASEMFLFRSVLSPRRASEAVSQTASVNGLVGRGQTIEEEREGGGREKAIKEDAHPPFANDGEGFFYKKNETVFCGKRTENESHGSGMHNLWDGLGKISLGLQSNKGEAEREDVFQIT